MQCCMEKVKGLRRCLSALVCPFRPTHEKWNSYSWMLKQKISPERCNIQQGDGEAIRKLVHTSCEDYCRCSCLELIRLPFWKLLLFALFVWRVVEFAFMSSVEGASGVGSGTARPWIAPRLGPASASSALWRVWGNHGARVRYV